VTNDDTGESVMVNNSGPGTSSARVDEEAGAVTLVFDFKGPAVIFRDPSEEELFEAAGLPDVFATSGPFSGTVDHLHRRRHADAGAGHLRADHLGRTPTEPLARCAHGRGGRRRAAYGYDRYISSMTATRPRRSKVSVNGTLEDPLVRCSRYRRRVDSGTVFALALPVRSCEPRTTTPGATR
jgi:hypothetical protein